MDSLSNVVWAAIVGFSAGWSVIILVITEGYTIRAALIAVLRALAGYLFIWWIMNGYINLGNLVLSRLS